MPRIRADALDRITVLHEDDDLLLVSKPIGLAVHGGAGVGTSVRSLIEAAYAPARPIWLAHRLDRATSGLLVIAKSKAAVEQIQLDWPSADKVYVAVSLGLWPAPEVITAPLKDADGLEKPAHTEIRPLVGLFSDPAATVVEARIRTGRTHQIRRHLAGVGRPVAMDDRHGDFARNKQFRGAVRAVGGRCPKKGCFLHAARIRLLHPQTRAHIEVRAPVPEHWVRCFEALGVDVPEELS